MTLTKSQIEADLALAEKATPGEWERRHSQVVAIEENGDPWFVCSAPYPSDQDALNMDFIARARTALPLYAKALMEAMDREARLVEILRKALADEPWVDAARQELYGAAYHAQEKA